MDFVKLLSTSARATIINPAHMKGLLDLMIGESSSEEDMATAQAILERAGKVSCRFIGGTHELSLTFGHIIQEVSCVLCRIAVYYLPALDGNYLMYWQKAHKKHAHPLHMFSLDLRTKYRNGA